MDMQRVADMLLSTEVMTLLVVITRVAVSHTILCWTYTDIFIDKILLYHEGQQHKAERQARYYTSESHYSPQKTDCHNLPVSK